MLKGLISGLSRWLENEDSHKRRAPRVAQPALVVYYWDGSVPEGRRIRDISESDAFVECQMPASIPLYRLVHFQVERSAQDRTDLPAILRRGKLLSAVYRVGPYAPATGTPQGYAIRLLSEPAGASQSARELERIAVAN